MLEVDEKDMQCNARVVAVVVLASGRKWWSMQREGKEGVGGKRNRDEEEEKEREEAGGETENGK